MIAALARFITKRYRAALGGVIEVALVFAIASVLGLAAHKQYNHCMRRSRISATVSTLRMIHQALDTVVHHDGEASIAQRLQTIHLNKSKDTLDPLPCGKLKLVGTTLQLHCTDTDDAEEIATQTPEFKRESQTEFIIKDFA